MAGGGQAVGSFVNTSSSGSGPAEREGMWWLLAGGEANKNRIIRWTGNKGGQNTNAKVYFPSIKYEKKQ